MNKRRWLFAFAIALVLLLLGAAGLSEGPLRANDTAVTETPAVKPSTPQTPPSAVIEAKADNQPVTTVEAVPAPKDPQSATIPARPVDPVPAPQPRPRPQSPVQGVTTGNTLPVPVPKPNPLPIPAPVPVPQAPPISPALPQLPTVDNLLEKVTGALPKIHIGIRP